jgi:hypothetical protein
MGYFTDYLVCVLVVGCDSYLVYCCGERSQVGGVGAGIVGL